MKQLALSLPVNPCENESIQIKHEIILGVLSNCEAEVALTSSVAEALALIERFGPQVIVSDRPVRDPHPAIESPGCDGTAGELTERPG